jgi:hypothetical protein
MPPDHVRTRRDPRPVAMRAPTVPLTTSSAAGRARVREVLRAGRPQAKLTVGLPDDAYEREAGRVADAVVRMPEPVAADARVQRTCAGCEEELRRHPAVETAVAAPLVLRRCGCGGCAACAGAAEEPGGELRRSGKDDGLAGTEAPAEVREALDAPGEKLDSSVRRFMEPRFGHDFGGVRVHADARAAQSAAAVRARGYTVGNDVVFGAGEYRPDSAEGRLLLAHELTHVVQQGGTATDLEDRDVVQRDDEEESRSGAEFHLTPESASAVIDLALEGRRITLSGELTQLGNLITDLTGVPLPLPRSTLDVSAAYVDECNRAVQSVLVGVRQEQAAGARVLDFSGAEWSARIQAAIRWGWLRIEPSGSITFVGDQFQALNVALTFIPGVSERIPERCRPRRDRDRDRDRDVPGRPPGGEGGG